jgi:hypothetical protein
MFSPKYAGGKSLGLLFQGLDFQIKDEVSKA